MKYLKLTINKKEYAVRNNDDLMLYLAGLPVPANVHLSGAKWLEISDRLIAKYKEIETMQFFVSLKSGLLHSIVGACALHTIAGDIGNREAAYKEVLPEMQRHIGFYLLNAINIDLVEIEKDEYNQIIDKMFG